MSRSLWHCDGDFTKFLFLVLVDPRESLCGNLFDVSDGRICHISSRQHVDHFCQSFSTTIHFHPAPGGEQEDIPFANCDSESQTDYDVVRALCTIDQTPTVETGSHFVWTASSDTFATDPDTPAYVFIFDVTDYALFAFQVNGKPIGCINDRHRVRAVICLIQATGSSVSLYRYTDSDDGWSESDMFTELLNDPALLASSSFVLEHCVSATAPLIIVGTIEGVQSVEIGQNPHVHVLTSLQAVKLLKPELCGGVLYIFTSEGVQLYDVHRVRARAFHPVNWSAAELSLERRRIALAGTYPAEQSCWIQVWSTENQEVMLNVTHEDCNIASIAVSVAYVCYHMTNISDNTWKLACIALDGNGKELVLWEGKQRGLRDFSLILGGNVLVEREFGASLYRMKFFHLPQKTAVHSYKSSYSVLAYPHLASGSRGCHVNPFIEPSTVVQAPTTAGVASLSNSVSSNSISSSSIQPSASARGVPGDFANAPPIVLAAVFAVSGVVGVALCIGIICLVAIMVYCQAKKNRRCGKYPTKEENAWIPEVKKEGIDKEGSFDV